jgi:type I restriction enzyme S subunit
MKQGWEIKKLDDVCTIKGRIGYRGYTKQDLVEEGEGAISLSPSNIKDNQIIYKNCTYISWFKYDESPEIKIFEGDIIYCKTASIGKIALIENLPEKATINPQFVVLKELKCSSKFLFFFLNSREFKEQEREIIVGTAIPTLSQANLGKLKIPLPPLPEQQRIVAILDEAFAAIAKAKANAEQNLKNAKELFESYLQGVFENKGEGWEEKTLKDVCAKITDGTHQTPKYFDNGVIFLSSKNVTSGKIDWDDIKYIDEKQHLEMHKRVAPRIGDILLAKNGTTGVAAMVDRDLVFDIYVSLAHIRVLDEVTPDFMLYFINSPVAKKQFNKRLKGSGVPNLHLEEIREVVIPFPKSTEEQKNLVQKLDEFSAETNRLEAIYSRKINDLEELKKSILQKAFNGELNDRFE